MTLKARVPLYDRIPEIYRVEDEKQVPPGQLEAYLALIEDAFGEIHKNIEALYHQFFIETCDDWAIPYIGDLLGASHLGGNAKFSRRDVADTIALRRRKGTLGAIELLTEDLTGWGVHATELFHDLAWSQHLNHQRPDAGGLAPYGPPTVDRHTVVRGGTAALRDPATLALLDSPFDPFARLPDFGPAARGELRVNLPNLAVFLWRLQAYRVTSVKPVFRGSVSTGLSGGLARRIARFDLHPLGDPIRLFNNGILDSNDKPVLVTDADVKPGPIHRARLNSMRPPLHEGSQEPAAKAVGDLWFDTDTERWKEWNGSVWNEVGEPVVNELVSGGYGRPDAYAEVVPVGSGPLPDDANLALQLLVPKSAFPDAESDPWSFRGANLIAWEQGLRRPLENREIAIDPETGRVAIGVNTANQVTRLRRELRVTYTYGAMGPVGAHPIDRSGSTKSIFRVDGSPGKKLEDALIGAELPGAPIIIEIVDNGVHDLSVGAVPSAVNELGGSTLVVGREIEIRAGDGKRPIVRLQKPLRFRAAVASGARQIKVTLKGLYLARGPGWTPGDALIERADVGHLVLEDCTLDPGGTEICPGAGRQPIHPAMRLRAAHLKKVSGKSEIHVRRSVCGPLLLDPRYQLTLESSMIDAGSGVNEDSTTAGYAIRGSGSSADVAWGPELQVASGATFLGRVKVERASGTGGIWTQPLEVLNNQTGCIKVSYLSGRGDRLPQTHACVSGVGLEAAFLRFVSEIYNQPGYGQLSLETDFRIRERGPRDDAMGAFGFLLEAHKWRNVQIRYREFMPVGVRPLLVPVT